MYTKDHPVPRATYRLQLNAAFPFTAASALAPYLERLGISHAYLSPILKAQPGSTHGYDTVDHSVINPELGTIGDFREMAAAFRRHGLGIVLDFVPNHMGVGGSANPQWLDVLEWGRDSRYADWFDINWAPADPSLADKLLVPFLGVPYGEALTTGVLELRFDEAEQKFAVWAHATHKLPVCPDTYSSIVADLADGPAVAAAVEGFNADPIRLDSLIRQQNWRIADARVAADDVNYRRFFTVSELGGIRIEREVVFDHAHRLIFGLIADGLVDGLRIDHIDGLADPRGYCLALRRKAPRPIYLVVEKILAPDEDLRPDWQVDGTTGYEFTCLVSPLLTEPAAEEPLTRLYKQFTGMTQGPQKIEYDAKLRVMDNELAAELDALSHRLRRLAASHTRTLDLTRNALKRALREFVAVLPVYRTYLGGGPSSDADTRTLSAAIATARRNRPTWNPGAFDFLEQLMSGQLTVPGSGFDHRGVREAVRRIQQYSGPVMAKGLEDTALYRYNRLVALDEVGERPQIFSVGIDAFHAANARRQALCPASMLTLSSHDTKRGEDTRARILALTGDVNRWAKFVADAGAALTDNGAPRIDPNDLYLFLQLLVGAWPTELSGDPSPEPRAIAEIRQRLTDAMMKSLREARLNSDWISPDPHYEGMVTAVVEAALSPLPDSPILPLLRQFEPVIARWAADLSLIQTVFKFTVPGMPDTYQGAELWEQSLVDPDNRRAVDFEAREHLLGHIDQTENLAALAEDWRSGAPKLGMMVRLLRHRAHAPDLYLEGHYIPLSFSGPDAGRMVGFAREHSGRVLLVLAALRPWEGSPHGLELHLPAGLGGANWRDLFSRRELGHDDLANPDGLLATFPAAVIETA